MKKIFAVIISVLFLFSGCTAAENTKEPSSSGTDQVKSVWMTYFELEQFTSSSETAQDFEEKIKELAASLRAAKEAGVPMDKVTISSDGQGSWSNYDAAGNLTEMGVSSVDTMYRQVVYQVQNENMSLEEALSLGTSNVAKALEVYPKKGAVHEGSDADVLVLNGDLSMNTVIARGSLMMQDGVLLKKGTYEA